MDPEYYVVAQDGTRYGPAPVPTLKQWAMQGRIYPGTLVEESFSLKQMPIEQVPGMTFVNPVQPNPQVYMGHLQRKPASDERSRGDQMVTTAWILFGIGITCSTFGFVSCFVPCLAGFVLGLIGWFQASNAAKLRGVGAEGARKANIALVIVSLLATLWAVIMFRDMLRFFENL